MCQERWSFMRAWREIWGNHKMERACKKGVRFSRFRDSGTVWNMHYIILAGAAVFNISPQNSSCCLSPWYSLLWRTQCLVEPGSRKEKRSYPDDYTLFRISAFGGYYGIANKLVYFNCSGMYVFPVPTYPCLFLAHQKSRRFLFFFCPWIQRTWRKVIF